MQGLHLRGNTAIPTDKLLNATTADAQHLGDLGHCCGRRSRFGSRRLYVYLFLRFPSSKVLGLSSGKQSSQEAG